MKVFNLETLLSGDQSWMKNMKPVEERMDWKDFYRKPFCTVDDVIKMSYEELRDKLELEVNNLREAAIYLGWFDKYYGKDPNVMPFNLKYIWLECGPIIDDREYTMVIWDKKDYERYRKPLDEGLI